MGRPKALCHSLLSSGQTKSMGQAVPAPVSSSVIDESGLNQDLLHAANSWIRDMIYFLRPNKQTIRNRHISSYFLFQSPSPLPGFSNLHLSSHFLSISVVNHTTPSSRSTRSRPSPALSTFKYNRNKGHFLTRVSYYFKPSPKNFPPVGERFRYKLLRPSASICSSLRC